jgi:Tfp pilus assembly protein PilV
MRVEIGELRAEGRNSNCGLRHPGGTRDCGFIQANPKSEIRNPKSCRSGISLTEVLIAMGILTLGLLGVAALFPVGGYYMQRAEVTDRASAIAQSVMSDVVARGMLNPSAWWMWEKGSIAAPNPPGIVIPPANQQWFSRNVADMMRQQAAALATSATLTPAQRQAASIAEFGSSFVIDPLAAAGLSLKQNGFDNAGVVPASTYWISAPAPTPEWNAWVPVAALPGIKRSWPVHRVTIRQGPGTQMSVAVAERMFSSNDDLATDLPEKGDQPATQSFRLASADLNGDGNNKNDPLARQSRGDYSWIISVTPDGTAARDALARNPESFDYEVSVVVFYKRVLPKLEPQNLNDMRSNLELLLSNEREVRAKVVSTGPAGGELLLERFNGDLSPESAFAGLKAGQWILLCGPHPNSTDATPRFVLHWYQVLTIEGKDVRLNGTGTTTPAPAAADPERRLVTVRGPEWPWQPNITAGSPNLSNWLCAGIMPGAVAVHTKKLRLEGSLSSAYGAGWSSGSAPTSNSGGNTAGNVLR